ncbi:MAG: ParB/RepB/Spo0J family partition protein [Acetobacteraceae bacterium]
MAELRSVDPGSLTPNPGNPRRAVVPSGMDEQLMASIKTVGLIQPPIVKEVDGSLVIVAGNRRAKAAIAAGLDQIEVLVCDSDDTTDAMRSVSENLIRASMNAVDIWRATQTLESQGWNEEAIAGALALPVRMVKRLKLLAHLHPPMLDFMAKGSMPNEDQLRTIAAATADEQAQVWKKHEPKKGHDVSWHEAARALSKRRLPRSDARFDEELAQAYGVVWEDDLLAPAGEDSRYTTNVEGFFGAQQEWLQNNLPPGGTLLPIGEYGRPELPKKAEHVYGKPGKGDLVGYYLDHRSGEVKNIAYRLPEPKKTGKPAKRGQENNEASADIVPKPARPEVTQKGLAMIGDFRTDALHQALKEAAIDDTRMIALLVLALAGKNVSVQSGAGLHGFERETLAEGLIDGGTLTSDRQSVHDAARAMLAAVLSCRDNMSNSGIVARIAGGAIEASLHLPNMATEAFLSCLSKAGIERAAAAEGVRVEPRGKDTRAGLVERFKSGIYVYPGARFELSDQDIADAKAAASRRYVPGRGYTAGQPGADDEEGAANGIADPEQDGGTGDFDPADDPRLAEAAD